MQSSEMGTPLLELGKDAESQQEPVLMSRSSTTGWKARVQQMLPLLAVAVVVLAIAIGFVARDISVGQDIQRMQNRLAELQAEVQQTQTQAAMTSTANSIITNELRHQLPQLCSIECKNGGVPDRMCLNCLNCSAGFLGRWCHIPEKCNQTCAADEKSCKCRHGGEFNQETCSCECPPGWTGRRCLERVQRNMTVSDGLLFLERLYNRSRAHVEEYNKKRSVLQNVMLSTHIGNGVDSITRETKVPVLALSLPSDLASAKRVVSPKTGRTYVLPDMVNFAASPDTQPAMRGESFSGVNDYVAWVKQLRQDGKVPGAGLLRNIEHVQRLVAGFGDSFITMTQYFIHMFTTSFTTTNYENMKLDDMAYAALDYLPPSYDDSSKELYKAFLDYWGDSFAVEVTQGGLVEALAAVHKAICKTIPASAGHLSFINDRQRNFMAKYFGVLGGSNAWTSDAEYESNSAADSAACFGGDPNACVNILQDRADLRPWIDTLWDIPAAVSMKIVPVTAMIRDPAKKAAMQAAIDDRTNAIVSQFPSTGRDYNPCPPGMLTRPEDWVSVFGLRPCFFHGRCAYSPGIYFSLCRRGAFNCATRSFSVTCTQWDKTTLTFRVSGDDVGYYGTRECCPRGMRCQIQ